MKSYPGFGLLCSSPNIPGFGCSSASSRDKLDRYFILLPAPILEVIPPNWQECDKILGNSREYRLIHQFALGVRCTHTAAFHSPRSQLAQTLREASAEPASKLFRMTSCDPGNMCRSKVRSATNCLSRRFSSSSCLNRRCSVIPISANLRFSARTSVSECPTYGTQGGHTLDTQCAATVGHEPLAAQRGQGPSASAPPASRGALKPQAG
jgi:hypothetical protein